jgi:hypothetical protein
VADTNPVTSTNASEATIARVRKDEDEDDCGSAPREGILISAIVRITNKRVRTGNATKLRRALRARGFHPSLFAGRKSSNGN